MSCNRQESGTLCKYSADKSWGRPIILTKRQKIWESIHTIKSTGQVLQHFTSRSSMLIANVICDAPAVLQCAALPARLRWMIASAILLLVIAGYASYPQCHSYILDVCCAGRAVAAAAAIMRAIAEGGSAAAATMREAALTQGALLHHLYAAVLSQASLHFHTFGAASVR